MKRAATYSRVSTTDQRTDAQVAACRAECARRGWTIAADYVDDGITGGTMDRAQFNAMLESARRGEVQAIVTVASDRLGRDTVGVLLVQRELRELGVELVLLRDGGDDHTAAGIALREMQAVFASMEKRLISDRTKRALAQLKARGVKLGRPVAAPVEAIRAAKQLDPVASTRALAKRFQVSQTTVQRALQAAA
jgi:DNA invertase Pin-like site-specific DNA recombinase